MEREKIRLARIAKREGSFYVPDEPKLAFVVRIKVRFYEVTMCKGSPKPKQGINKIAPKPKKILQLLRLRRINSGTFLRITAATAEMLTIVEPFVTFASCTMPISSNF